MDTLVMKEKLHRFIETVEEKRMKVIYALFEQEIEEDDWEYTDEFKADLDARYNYYIKGGKMVSAEEANAQTEELLQQFKAR